MVLQAVALTLVGVSATAVVLVRDPLRQSMVLGVMGLLLACTFLLLQAPDVALSMLVVGTVAVPVLVLLTLRRVRLRHGSDEREERR